MSSYLRLAHRSASASAAVALRNSTQRCVAPFACHTITRATATAVAAIPSSAASPAACFHSSARRSAAAPTVVATPGSTIDFNLADIGEGIAECEVLKWFIKEGDTIAQFDKVCEVQSDKANVEITSRYDGLVTSLKYKVGDLAKVGRPLLSIKIAGSADGAAAATGEPAAAAAAAPAASSPKAAAAACPVEEASANGKVLTSPAVRRIAKEEKIDLTQVRATGPGGRILKEDVLNFIKGGRKATAMPSASAAAAAVEYSALAGAAPAKASGSTAKPIVPVSKYLREDKVIPITGLNRIMVQTMNAANAIPQLGYGDEIAVDNLYDLRVQLNKDAAKYGVKLSYMPFILKAASLALKQYPQLNAHTNADCSQVTHKAQHNLGLAMDTPRGLLVPNIKDCQDKSILEIAQEMARLAKLGSEGKLGRDDLTGGTFTISNIGTIGGTYLKPILVVPEVVIGALGAFQTLPRFDKDMNVKAARVMNISWSADHRVVDGATMARFSNLFKAYLENPTSMLLDTK
jgi:2-oxoisovalerate dehydrogenase E2 component (dihydrolipoyl transacylase)